MKFQGYRNWLLSLTKWGKVKSLKEAGNRWNKRQLWLFGEDKKRLYPRKEEKWGTLPGTLMDINSFSPPKDLEKQPWQPFLEMRKETQRRLVIGPSPHNKEVVKFESRSKFLLFIPCLIRVVRGRLWLHPCSSLTFAFSYISVQIHPKASSASANLQLWVRKGRQFVLHLTQHLGDTAGTREPEFLPGVSNG